MARRLPVPAPGSPGRASRSPCWSPSHGGPPRWRRDGRRAPRPASRIDRTSAELARRARAPSARRGRARRARAHRAAPPGARRPRCCGWSRASPPATPRSPRRRREPPTRPRRPRRGLRRDLGRPGRRLAERPPADTPRRRRGDRRSPAASSASTRSSRPSPATPPRWRSSIDGYLASKFSPLTGPRRGVRDRVARASASTRASSSRSRRGDQLRHLRPLAGASTTRSAWARASSTPRGPTRSGGAAQNLGGPIYLGDGRVTIVAIRGRWAPTGAYNDPTGLNSNWVPQRRHLLRRARRRPPGRRLHRAGAVPRARRRGAGGDRGPVVSGPSWSAPPPRSIGKSGKGAEAAQKALSLLGTPSVPAAPTRRAASTRAASCAGSSPARGDAAPGGRRPGARSGRPSRPPSCRRATHLLLGRDGAIVHEGLYVGGGQFVHAPAEGGVVRLSSLYEPEYAQSYAGARRY